MTKKFQTFVIDPWSKSIREVETDFTNIKELISTDDHKVELITVVRFTDHEDIVALDDESLLQPGRPVWRWSLDPETRGYAGCGLVAGTAPGGDTIAPGARITAAWLREHVVFTDLESTGDFGPGRTGTVMIGDMEIPAYIGGDPIFQPRGAHQEACDLDKAEQRFNSQ